MKVGMSVRKAFFWSLLGQGVSLGAMLVALVVLSRILDQQQMGAFATGQAVNGILMALTALGLGTYIQREAVIDDRVLGTALTINTLLGGVLALGTFFVSEPVARMMDDVHIAEVMRWLALVPLISSFELVPQAIMQRGMRFRPISMILSLRTIVNTGVSIAVALLGEPYLCVAYGTVAGALVSAIGSHLAAPGHLRISPSLAHWRRMSIFGVNILSVGGFSILATRASELATAAILGLAALGVFSRASTIYNVIYANIYGAIGKVMLARLAVDQRSHGSLAASYTLGLQATLGIMWPVLLGLAVLAGPAVNLVFGPVWLEAAAPLSILMLAQAIAMSFGMSYELFILKDELGRQMRYEGVRSVAIFLFVLLGCQFGINGVAFAWLSSIVLAAVMYFPHIVRLAEIRSMALARIFAVNLLLTAITLAPALILMAWFGFSPRTPLPFVAASVVIGGLFWIGALRLLRHPLDDELRRALRHARAVLRPAF